MKNKPRQPKKSKGIKTAKQDLPIEPTRYRYDSPTRFVGQTDSRHAEYAKFKEEHGFSPDETWSLDVVMEEFLLPRLKYYKEVTVGYPPDLETMERWHEVLDEIIWMMEQDVWDMNGDDRCFLNTNYTLKELKAYNRRMGKARKLFGKYWMSLWW